MTTVAVTKSDKYCGEGGNPQRFFIADANKGWSDLKADASKHLIVGQTQLDCIKSLGSKMDGQARRVLENFVATWDFVNPLNANLVQAAAREMLRAPWRAYYKSLAVYTMRLTNITNPGAVLASPNTLVVLVPEPAELEEFLTLLDLTFQAAHATYLQDLKAFKTNPRESLLQMADIYDESAIVRVGRAQTTLANEMSMFTKWGENMGKWMV